MKIVRNSERGITAEIEKVGNSHYTMNYLGDYGFNEYLKRGVNSLDEHINFVEQRLLLEHTPKKEGKNFGCAAFFARTQENDVIFGRNMDCECGIGMVTRIKESYAYQSLALTNMAELDWEDNTYDTLEKDAKYTLATPYSPCDGMNEYGLSIAVLSDAQATYPQNHDITLLDFSIPRLVLDRAKNVEEAIHLIQNYNLIYIVAPLHYMVADADGNSAVIEFVNGKMEILKKQGNYQVVTNFTLFDNPLHQGFGKDRFENIEARLHKHDGVISENDALELLKANVIPGDEQWSAVYNLTKRTMMITFARDYETVYRYQIDC